MGAFYWLIAVAGFLAIEAMTMGLTAIWFAGGSLAAFLAALLGLGVAAQVAVFLLVSVVLLLFTRPVAARHFNGKRVRTNAESLVGTDARVTERIDNLEEKGTVVANGLEWSARSEDGQAIEEGSVVEILEIRGVKLIVRRKGE